MDQLDKIFGYYDQATAQFNPNTQALVAILLLILLVFQIYHVIKSGHWIFIAALILFLPGTWPAAKYVGNLIWLVIKFLITRAQSAL